MDQFRYGDKFDRADGEIITGAMTYPCIVATLPKHEIKGQHVFGTCSPSAMPIYPGDLLFTFNEEKSIDTSAYMPENVQKDQENYPLAFAYLNGLPVDPSLYRFLGMSTTSYRPLDMKPPVITYTPTGKGTIVWPHHESILPTRCLQGRVLHPDHPDFKLCKNTTDGTIKPFFYSTEVASLDKDKRSSSTDDSKLIDTWNTGSFQYFSDHKTVPEHKDVRPLPSSWRSLLVKTDLKGKFRFEVLQFALKKGLDAVVRASCAPPADDGDDSGLDGVVNEDEEEDEGIVATETGLCGAMQALLVALGKDLSLLVSSMKEDSQLETRSLIRVVQEYAAQVQGAIMMVHAARCSGLIAGDIKGASDSLEASFPSAAGLPGGGGAHLPALNDWGRLGSWCSAYAELIANCHRTLDSTARQLNSQFYVGTAMTRGNKDDQVQIMIGMPPRTQGTYSDSFVALV